MIPIPNFSLKLTTWVCESLALVWGFAKWIFLRIRPAHEDRGDRLSKRPDLDSYNTKGLDYKPPVLNVIHHSRNAVIARLDPGVILKYPRYAWWEESSSGSSLAVVQECKAAFAIEEKILEVLGDHSRLMKFFGASYELRGLRFREANGGDLQAYLDHHFSELDEVTKMTWCIEAAESIAFIHSKGVIHSDLRPENFLVHWNPDRQGHLYLCDFGGANYKDLTTQHLPDSGFFDPRKEWISTEATDIFSLGSILYTLMTGHWPHYIEGEGRLDYGDRVDQLFLQSIFPETGHIRGGHIIRGCWQDSYEGVGEVLKDYVTLVK